MSTHVKVLGWIYLALGLFGLFGALMIMLLGMGGGMIAAMEDVTAGLIAGGGTMLVAIIAVVFSLPAVLTGWGLLTRRSWARPLAIVVGIVNLINIPLGTILGVYTLWAMFQDEVKLQLS
ncbi:MAG TPA: hypothetical protein VGE02_11550 [Gemmatimonadales bacterium]